MKKQHIIIVTLMALFFGFSPIGHSQNIAINTSGNPSPNATAILDLSDASNNKLGVLLPNVSISAFNTIAPFTAAPTTGMIVWNTNAAMVGGFGVGFYYWSGTQWNYIQNSGTASAGWNTTGNAGTNPAVNYAGTSDPQPFVIKTQGIERMRFMAGGGAGIGTATPASAVDVNGNMTIGTYAGTNAAPANGVIISGQVGLGTNAPNASAALDVTSTTKGFLTPRMTGAQMAAIAAPATGLLVFNTTTNCLEFYTSTVWQNVVCPCTGPPGTPGTITGNATPCVSSAGNVYSIAAVPNAISYNWTVPAGALITAGSGTTSITVTFGTTSGNITVTATNSCGTSGASTLAVTLTQIPVAPAIPSGTTAPTISTSNTYTIATVIGATTYTWSTSNTNLGTVSAGQGTTSATILSTSTPGTYTICVTAGNACGTSASSCLTVTSSACSVTHGTVTFTYTGSLQTWTVPCGITVVTLDLRGAQGGSSAGLGGRVVCTYPTAPATVFNIYVGGQGGAEASAAPGGWNGGGNAGTCSGYYLGSGGGGMSDIRVGGTAFANWVAVAGGGGGTQQINGNPGAGGGLTGGSVGSTGNGCISAYATGGTQVGGGTNCTSSGACCFFTATANGTQGTGANGSGPSTSCNNGDGGGGGGGGYYGGGAGGGYSSGGGGSSWTSGACTAVTHTQGYNTGNGSILITY